MDNGYFADNRNWLIIYKNGTHQVIAGYDSNDESFETLFIGHYDKCVKFVEDLGDLIAEAMI